MCNWVTFSFWNLRDIFQLGIHCFGRVYIFLLYPHLPNVILSLNKQGTPPPPSSLSGWTVLQTPQSAHRFCFSLRAWWISSILRWQTKHSVERYLCFPTPLHLFSYWLSKCSIFLREDRCIQLVFLEILLTGKLVLSSQNYIAAVSSSKGRVVGSM